METQISHSDPPPCDTQPSGKINKAAFKLFGKRRSGSGMPSIFPIRNKGYTTDQELVRSKTHDGLTTSDELSELKCHVKEESASSDGLNSAAAAAPACSAITKSFSFFSLLRRNSSRISDRAATLGQRGRGLKGLFNSIRWRRKPPSRDESIEIHDIVKEAKGVDLILSCSSKNIDVENVILTLEPPIQILQGNDATWENPSLQDSNEEHVMSSCALAQPVAEEFPVPSPVAVQTQEVLRDKHGSPAHLASMTPPQDRSSVDPPSEDRISSIFNDVTSLKSFDSLTGCGDIIADQEEDSGNGGSVTGSGTGSSNAALQVSAERCSTAKPPLPPQVTGLMSTYTPSRHRICPPTKTPQGSGIVAYMGGGEEMASPEGVDDADMQGLWHMLPQKGEDSPALPHLPTRQDKRPPQVKSLGLSKIPVGGSSRVGKQQQQQQLSRPSPPPMVKDLQDVPPSDEGYWDSPTPGPEDEDSGFLRRDGLPRDSCSGDALYDLYDLDSPGTLGSDDDSTISPTPSSGDLKMTPPSKKPSCSSFRSIKGSTSLPRDSKIPISVRQKPASHSSSQGALSSPVSSTSNNPSDSSSKTNSPPRTRIPVSKVPVRSSGNKNMKAAQNRK